MQRATPLELAGWPGPGCAFLPQVLFAACELGVFDLLDEAPGPLDVEAIAGGLGASPRGTERLLQACVPLRLLEVDSRAGTGELRAGGRRGRASSGRPGGVR